MNHYIFRIVLAALATISLANCAENHFKKTYSCATVAFTDTVDNKITNVRLLKSSGDKKLDEFAEKSVGRMVPPKRPPTAIKDMNFSVPICFPKNQEGQKQG